MPGEKWASDVPVSRPMPVSHEQPALVFLDGFSFSTGGICHDLSEAEIEEMFTPTYAPPEATDGR